MTEVLPPPPDSGDDGGVTAKKNKKPTGPKPRRTGSLFRSMDLPDRLTLEDARLLSPAGRRGGPAVRRGSPQNGRYGPYLQRGTDSRSLATEAQLFDVTLEEALKIYAEPSAERRGAATPPLRELGVDPASGKPMVIKDGRFGPAYVTDGKTNASLRKGDDVLSITDERASNCSPAPGPRPGPGQTHPLKKVVRKKRRPEGRQTRLVRPRWGFRSARWAPSFDGRASWVGAGGPKTPRSPRRPAQRLGVEGTLDRDGRGHHEAALELAGSVKPGGLVHRSPICRTRSGPARRCDDRRSPRITRSRTRSRPAPP